MSSLIRVSIILGICLFIACDRSPEEEVESGEPETLPAPVEVEVPILEDEPAEEPEFYEPEAVEFLAWPGSGEHRSFALMWLGGGEEVDLRREPYEEAEVLTSVRWLDGEEVPWLETRLRVDEPRPLVVEEAVRISGTPYDADYRELEAREREYSLEEGETIYFYQSAGENTCYFGIQGEVIHTGCGLMTALDGGDEELRPISQEWWVKVEANGQQGWFLVDDAPVDVHERRLDGYDDLDESEEHDEFNSSRL